MSLNDLARSLRAALEPLEAARAVARWEQLCEGELPRPDPSRTSTFARAEAFHAFREAQEGASERARPRLRRLQALAARAFEAHLATDAWDTRRSIEQQARLEAGLGGHSLVLARWMVDREPQRERREALERGIADQERALLPTTQRLTEASLRAAEALGAGTPLALWDSVFGFAHTAWLEAGAVFEAETRAGYLDLLQFSLDRSGPRLRPLPRGEAALHDVRHAARLPWLEALLPREALLPALQRWTGDLFGDWTAGGRIRVLLDEGPPHAAPGAVGLSLPNDVRLSVQRERGVEGWRALLHAVGDAQALAQRDPNAPAEDRRLGDGAVLSLPGLLAETLLLEPRWLMRYVRVTAQQARELSRFAAFAALTRSRVLVAQLELEQFALTGPSSEHLERFAQERFAQALAARAPGPRVTAQLQPGLPSVHPLRGFALVGQLLPILLERFDEDWWRNPAAGRFLGGLFAQGGREEALQLVTGWGMDSLTLDRWQSRLLACMSA